MTEPELLKLYIKALPFVGQRTLKKAYELEKDNPNSKFFRALKLERERRKKCRLLYSKQ